MQIADALRRVPLFQALDADGVRSLAEIGNERAARAGDVVFRQGDVGDALYIVLEGAVRISKVEGDRELELGIELAGDYFGEMSLIEGSSRSATAAVAEDGRLFVVGRSDYLSLLAKSPEMLRDVLGRLTRNLHASNAHRFGLLNEKDQVRAESELERLRSLSQMVAGVAHEINTPLGIIQNASTFITDQLRGSIDALAKDAAARETLGDVVEACDLIERNIAIASKLIVSFKSLSVRQIADRREEADILQVVSEVVSLYRFKARSSHLELKVQCALAEADRRWDGFPGHLSQILLNLVTNVDRYAYADHEGGRVEIVVAAAELRAGVAGFEISVRDFGRGIPEADLGRIFDPFFTTGRDKDGTGLGLAIVHNLVTSSLGGTIRVESKLGEGTTFSIRFPRVIPKGAQDG